MFADDKSIENMQQLFIEFKKYLELQKEYTKLEVTEKLSKLLSTLLLIVLLVLFRKKLIIDPTVKLIAELFLDN